MRRHLLVAAALGEIMEPPPIVVGSTAVELYTNTDLGLTELEMWGSIGDAERDELGRAGFRAVGRHWVRDGLNVAMEFSPAALPSEQAVAMKVSGGTAHLISVEDLYLDCLRQSAAHTQPDQRDEYEEALAIAAVPGDRFDWSYVSERMAGYVAEHPELAAVLPQLNELARGALADLDGGAI